MLAWLIAAGVFVGLVLLLVWALCRIAGRTEREIERQAATWPLVCLGRLETTAEFAEQGKSSDRKSEIPSVSSALSALSAVNGGPDCRAPWHAVPICAQP